MFSTIHLPGKQCIFFYCSKAEGGTWELQLPPAHVCPCVGTDVAEDGCQSGEGEPSDKVFVVDVPASYTSEVKAIWFPLCPGLRR